MVSNINWYKFAKYKKLYVMRGVSGSGKSTVAKNLPGVLEQNIFSTDNLIGDGTLESYLSFFESMQEKKDFSPLSDLHKKNTDMVKDAIVNGIAPIVLDNTNLQGWECKDCVEYAIQNGYEVEFIDVGTGGKTIEELADRNTHGVPKEVIQKMVDKYESEGELTVEKVLNSISPNY